MREINGAAYDVAEALYRLTAKLDGLEALYYLFEGEYISTRTASPGDPEGGERIEKAEALSAIVTDQIAAIRRDAGKVCEMAGDLQERIARAAKERHSTT